MPAGVAPDVRVIGRVAGGLDEARALILRDLAEHLVVEDAAPLMTGTLVAVPAGRYIVEPAASRPPLMYQRQKPWTARAAGVAHAPDEDPDDATRPPGRAAREDAD